MSKIIACVDNSKHQKSVCELTVWINKNTNLEVLLLHVAKPHDEFKTQGNFSGSIGIGAQSGLLKELSEQDEQQGKLEQKKGQKILQNASKKLSTNNIKNFKLLHRRGNLSDTLLELQEETNIVVLGKKGEDNIGANLEDVISNSKNPVLVVPEKNEGVKNFVIAYDGSDLAKKALEFVCSNSLFKGLDCHLVKVDQKTGNAEEILSAAKNKLKKAGFNITVSLKEGNIDNAVNDYIKENNIDLLVIGAYGHSKIREFFLGSTTNALINKTQVPILLFK